MYMTQIFTHCVSRELVYHEDAITTLFKMLYTNFTSLLCTELTYNVSTYLFIVLCCYLINILLLLYNS